MLKDPAKLRSLLTHHVVPAEAMADVAVTNRVIHTIDPVIMPK